MANPIYFNSIRGKSGKYGIKLTGKAQDIIEEIQKHTNAKGYINLELKERRSEGKYGETHYVVVDTYAGQQEQREQPAPPPPASQQGWTEPAGNSEDDLPF